MVEVGGKLTKSFCFSHGVGISRRVLKHAVEMVDKLIDMIARDLRWVSSTEVVTVFTREIDTTRVRSSHIFKGEWLLVGI